MAGWPPRWWRCARRLPLTRGWTSSSMGRPGCGPGYSPYRPRGWRRGWPSSQPRCFSCLPPPSPSAAWSRAPFCRPCGSSGCCAVPASAFASARSDGRRHHLCRDHPCEDRRAGSARRTRIPRPPRTATLSRRPSPTSRRSCCLTAGGSRAGSAWQDRGIRHAAATSAMQSTGQRQARTRDHRTRQSRG